MHRTSPILLWLAILSLISTPPARAGGVLFIYPTLVMFVAHRITRKLKAKSNVGTKR